MRYSRKNTVTFYKIIHTGSSIQKDTHIYYIKRDIHICCYTEGHTLLLIYRGTHNCWYTVRHTHLLMSRKKQSFSDMQKDITFADKLRNIHRLRYIKGHTQLLLYWRTHTFAPVEMVKDSCCYTEGHKHVLILNCKYTVAVIQKGTDICLFKEGHTVADVQKNTYFCLYT